MPTKSEDRANGEAPKPVSKSKRIKHARKALAHALEEHAEIVSGSGVSLKKAQRAGAKLAAAAAEYAEAVTAKTGLDNPFLPGSGALDGATIQSLEAERTKIRKARTNALPIQAEGAGD